MSDGAKYTVLVRGTGDIASAVACRLFQNGYLVVLNEEFTPTASRRGMSFADCYFQGEAELDGVRARRVSDDEVIPFDVKYDEILMFVGAPIESVIAQIAPHILIDARMRKRTRPENTRGSAKLTVGLGPNFIAGENVDIAVETSWEDLGRVIVSGPTLEFRGEPKPIGGRARERYVYAPAAGTFRTDSKIGELVRKGDCVAVIDDVRLLAPLSGFLRGLTHDGVPVAEGTKVIEVDPREADKVMIWGIAERPERIAAGVLAAIELWREGNLND